ncbi:hypothetical protein GCM10017714_10630 [Curtobacterium pusillum]|nr:hypothetical protein GCM10017610_06080 [Curtobacterium pusillum]
MVEQPVADEPLVAGVPRIMREHVHDVRPHPVPAAHVYAVVLRSGPVLPVAERFEGRAEGERVHSGSSPCGDVDDRLRNESRDGGAADVLDLGDPALARSDEPSGFAPVRARPGSVGVLEVHHHEHDNPSSGGTP